MRDLGLGGVERCVALVSEGLIARGCEVSIVMLGGQRNLWAARTDKAKIIDLSQVWQGKTLDLASGLESGAPGD